MLTKHYKCLYQKITNSYTKKHKYLHPKYQILEPKNYKLSYQRTTNLMLIPKNQGQVQGWVVSQNFNNWSNFKVLFQVFWKFYSSCDIISTLAIVWQC